MDLSSDINKISNRRKITADAEELREKALRGTENLIKIQVAQNTSYWDMKEKLHRVEAGRDHRKNRMVEVQMLYETVSAQYQDELRRRPEILNKALEEYVEQLRGELRVCKTNKESMQEAYEKSCSELIQMSDVFVTAINQFRLENVSMLSRLKASEDRTMAAETSHDAKMSRVDALERQTHENAEQAEHIEAAVATSQADCNRLVQESLEQTQKNTELRRRREQYNEEFEIKITNLRNRLAHQQRQYAEAQTVSKEESELLQMNESRIIELEASLRDMRLEQEAMLEKDTCVERELIDADKILNSKESEMNEVIRRISALELENAEIRVEAQRSLDECEKQYLELTHANQEAVIKTSEAQKRLDELRTSGEKAVEELTAKLEQKNLELEAKAEAVARFMINIKTESEANERLEVALNKVKETAQASTESQCVLRTQTESLESSLQEKNFTIANMAESIRQSKSEKERLQANIQGLQNTIENIQKELKVSENLKQQGRNVGTAAAVAPIERKRDLPDMFDFVLDSTDEEDPKMIPQKNQQKVGVRSVNRRDRPGANPKKPKLGHPYK